MNNKRHKSLKNGLRILQTEFEGMTPWLFLKLFELPYASDYLEEMIKEEFSIGYKNNLKDTEKDPKNN